jgi:hypothetical protein
MMTSPQRTQTTREDFTAEDAEVAEEDNKDLKDFEIQNFLLSAIPLRALRPLR